MPQSLKVESHLSPSAMNQWLMDSPTPAIRRRRLAIKLASRGGQRAADIAEELNVATDTVRIWVRAYNKQGPRAHGVDGRGGRRNDLMSRKAEAEFVASCRGDAEAGKIMTGQQIRRKAAGVLGRMPSQPWVYFMLERHDWRKVVPRPTHVKGDPARREAFKKDSRKSSASTVKRRGQ